jgi:hypothetical protein
VRVHIIRQNFGFASKIIMLMRRNRISTTISGCYSQTPTKYQLPSTVNTMMNTTETDAPTLLMNETTYPSPPMDWPPQQTGDSNFYQGLAYLFLLGEYDHRIYMHEHILAIKLELTFSNFFRFSVCFLCLGTLYRTHRHVPSKRLGRSGVASTQQDVAAGT